MQKQELYQSIERWIDNTDSKPILFCSELCLNSFEDEKFNSTINYEDPNEVRTLVQNLVSQT